MRPNLTRRYLPENPYSDTKRKSEKKLVMTSEGNSFFPIAVMAERIDWDKGEFAGTKLVTDNRFFF